MRTLLTLLLTCLFVARIVAQEITSGQASFLPGETYLMHEGPPVAPGLDGAAVTWDFSSFSPTSDVSEAFVAPGSTLYSGSFPTATVAEATGPNAWVYFRSTADVFEQLGIRDPDRSVICNTGVTVIPYPISYGGAITDQFTCNGVTSGDVFVRDGSITVTADGYGDIILPYGTINNVLRVYAEETYTDVGDSVDDFGYLTRYLWYKPGIHSPVMALYHIETYDIVLDYTSMADAWSIGIQEAQRNAIGIELYPNPASHTVSVVLGAKGRLHLELIDDTGKTVRTLDLGDRAPGIQKGTIDLEGLSSGPYLVRVTDDHGGTGSQRLLVQ